MTSIKRYLLIGAALLVTHAGAFAAGRYLTPEKVVERERVEVKVVEVEKQVVVVQEKVRVEKVYVADTKKRIHREEHITEHPNGLRETHKSEDVNVDKVVKEHDVQYVDRVVEKETIKYVDRVVEKEKEKVVEAGKPDWRVGGLIGLDTEGWANFTPAKPVYGGIVERRILGPVSAGAWGLSSGQVGLMVSLEL